MTQVKAYTLLVGLLLAQLTLVPNFVQAVPHKSVNRDEVKPLLASENADVIPGHYLVVLKDGISSEAIEQHHNWLSTAINMNSGASGNPSDEVKHIYNLDGMKGYAGKFQKHIIDSIRTSPQVAYIEQDQIVRTQELQKDAPWGLSRISHRSRPTSDVYNQYQYNADAAGRNVTVVVIDTGINIGHVDFEGRAKWGITIPQNDQDIDGNGHGTHCAGTIGGRRYGVAKKVNLVAVKVLSSNGSGSMSDVIKGVEWAVMFHRSRQQKEKNPRTVANMSLGGGASRTLDRAVNAAVDAGVHFAVAAGNDNKNACDYSPAAAEKAVTVGATVIDDTMAYFSNYGKCVDVFAPGKDITSTWIGSNVATNTISGTSMASPHVAGLMAYLLSSLSSDQAVTGAQLKDLIVQLATKGMIRGIPSRGKDKMPKFPFPWPPGEGLGSNPGKTPNYLAFNGFGNNSESSKMLHDAEIDYVEKKAKSLTQNLESNVVDNFLDVEGQEEMDESTSKLYTGEASLFLSWLGKAVDLFHAV